MSENYIYHLRVGYEDTDCNGIVYHPNYLKFMERARCEYLRHKGLSFQRAKKDNILFAIQSAQLDYLKPAFLEDMLEVETSLIKIGGASLVFAQSIRALHAPNIIYCVGKIKTVCINNEYKPRPLPKFLLMELKSGN